MGYGRKEIEKNNKNFMKLHLSLKISKFCEPNHYAKRDVQVHSKIESFQHLENDADKLRLKRLSENR